MHAHSERRKRMIQVLMIWFIALVILVILWMIVAWTVQTMKDNMPQISADSVPTMSQAEVEPISPPKADDPAERSRRFISYYEHAMNDGYVDTDTHVEEDEAYRLDVNAQLMCNLIEESNNLVEPFDVGLKLGMSSDQTRYVIEGAVLVYCPMYTNLLDTGAM